MNVASTPNKKTAKNISSDEKVALIVGFADDMKAENIETLDIRKKTSVADYFVICSGNSDTHMKAIAERVAEKMRDLGQKPLRQADVRADGWILFDYGDVVFHIMLEEKRQFYDLESLWTNMPQDPSLID